MPRPFPARTRTRALYAVVLALSATACLPPDPFELVEATDELPPGICERGDPSVGPGRWQLERQFAGMTTTTQPGELAPAKIEISLAQWPSEHLLDMRLELEVVAGQALPGQALVLRHGSEPLQEAQLAGPHGNTAHFDVELSRDLCGTPCLLSLGLSGPLAESAVPVPLKVSGKLLAFVDSTRERYRCSENALYVGVSNAP